MGTPALADVMWKGSPDGWSDLGAAADGEGAESKGSGGMGSQGNQEPRAKGVYVCVCVSVCLSECVCVFRGGRPKI